VAAAVRWYARVDGRQVSIVGQLTAASLEAAGFLHEDGTVATEDLAKGVDRLQTAVIKRMNKVAAGSGFAVEVKLADLAKVTAASFANYSLLVR
jgi:hypothetical protein